MAKKTRTRKYWTRTQCAVFTFVTWGALTWGTGWPVDGLLPALGLALAGAVLVLALPSKVWRQGVGGVPLLLLATGGAFPAPAPVPATPEAVGAPLAVDMVYSPAPARMAEAMSPTVLPPAPVGPLFTPAPGMLEGALCAFAEGNEGGDKCRKVWAAAACSTCTMCVKRTPGPWWVKALACALPCLVCIFELTRDGCPLDWLEALKDQAEKIGERCQNGEITCPYDPVRPY